MLLQLSLLDINQSTMFDMLCHSGRRRMSGHVTSGTYSSQSSAVAAAPPPPVRTAEIYSFDLLIYC